MRPSIVAVGGFASNSGKTTLVCELLRALGGWEAIKMTRGHYRSCGRDPHACCVSPMLGEEPVVLSGRETNEAEGKDTGRFWESGASNVHWVVVTDRQVEQGFRTALSRVRSPGVVVEGNSFLNFAEADFTIMVARAGLSKIKPTARRAFGKASALYVSQLGGEAEEGAVEDVLERLRGEDLIAGRLAEVPVYTRASFPRLVAEVRAAVARRGAGVQHET